MTIQNIPSTNSNNFSITTKNDINALSNIQSSNELLTPEQQNTLKDDFNTRITEQANDIKDNFQTAKDIDLTRAYYDQQQKLVDIYMKSGTNNEESSNSNRSATKALTDTYDSLYQLHQTIKGGNQQPILPDEIQPPTTNPEIQLVETAQSLAKSQTSTYNNFMMPTTSSYIHLSA